MAKKLKPKRVKGRVILLRAMPHKGIMVYLRMIKCVSGDIFEYIIPFKGEIYTSYLIMIPAKGKTKLTKDEIDRSATLIFSGAITTIEDTLLKKKLDKKTKENVKIFEDSRKQVEAQANGETKSNKKISKN